MATTRTILCLTMLAALASPLASSNIAAAGVEMHGETRSDGPVNGDETTRRSHIWIDGQRLRMEVSGDAKTGDAIVIFRGDKKLFWTLDADTRSYAQLDEKEMRAMSERLQAARRELEARLAALPAEQRELVEQMMERALPPVVAPEPERLEKTDERRRIDDVPVRRTLLRLGDDVVGDVWTADWKQVGVRRRQLRVFKSLASFQRDLLASLGQAIGTPLAAEPFALFEKLDGFPLLLRRLEGERVTSETRFSRIRSADLDAALFEIPDGWTLGSGDWGQ